jgi:hypothetical protein
VSGFCVFVLCCAVFVVLNAILMSVFFSRFVIVLTFGLWYVNIANFFFFCSLIFGSCCFYFCFVSVISFVIRCVAY